MYIESVPFFLTLATVIILLHKDDGAIGHIHVKLVVYSSLLLSSLQQLSSTSMLVFFAPNYC